MIEKIEECGCEHQYVNGRWIHIFCDEHEPEEYYEIQELKKFNKHQMYYD